MGIVAILAWMAGSVVAWRILGPYPSKAARATLFLGWIVALASTNADGSDVRLAWIL